MKKLAICIPNFNRLDLLNNCLNSIYIASKNSHLDFEVCISDNFSDGDIFRVVNQYNDKLTIKLNKNEKNLGLGVNILKSVSIANSEYCWIIGNDDLLMPYALKKIEFFFLMHKDVDFYYINSFHLHTKDIEKYRKPFDSNILLNFNMKKFSNYKKDFKKDFFELIKPSVSFDFLLGMFLCIFKKKYWDKNLIVINTKLLQDLETYSSFDNTCPHIKIWATSFKNKMSYFCSDPLSVNLSGERGKEWGHLYPFVEAIRIPEVLDYYRKNGLPLTRYIICKNFALRRFLPSLIKILCKPKTSGLKFIEFKNHILKNILYPSIYLFPIYMVFRKVTKFAFNFLKK